MIDKIIQDKKVALIIAFHDFRDEEYFIPRQVLLASGATVTTVSSKKGKAIGSYGGTVDAKMSLDEMKVKNFDAVLFIGGSGAASYVRNEKCLAIARETFQKKKPLGAICIAPIILARAGVLKGRNATVWSSNLDKSAIKLLKAGGAHYQSRPVVIDGLIITASGPLAARQFGEAVVNSLTNR